MKEKREGIKKNEKRKEIRRKKKTREKNADNPHLSKRRQNRSRKQIHYVGKESAYRRDGASMVPLFYCVVRFFASAVSGQPRCGGVARPPARLTQ